MLLFHQLSSWESAIPDHSGCLAFGPFVFELSGPAVVSEIIQSHYNLSTLFSLTLLNLPQHFICSVTLRAEQMSSLSC